MAELYVSTAGSDRNSGSRNSPFKTIEKAADAAGAGTTVHVSPGTYEGGFTTETNNVTYVSDVKWGARIVPGPDNDQYEAWKNQGDRVTIDGFEVDGSRPQGDTPWLYGVYTAGSDSVVKNTKVHDIARSSAAMDAAAGGQGGAGIMGDGWSGDTDITVRDNTVYNIGPDGEDSTLVHGIYMATSGEVLNNVVHHVVGDGITSWHDATDLTISGNRVYEANGAGILIGAGDQYHGGGSNDHSTVSNNTVTDSLKGIEENGDVGENNTYSGNTVRNNGTDWALQSGSRAAAASAPDDADGQDDVLAFMMREADTLADRATAQVEAALPAGEWALPSDALATRAPVDFASDPVAASQSAGDTVAMLVDRPAGSEGTAPFFTG